MKKYLAAIIFAALAQPASAVTFPSLTTIYVGSGVLDNGGATNLGMATSIHCSNVSGVSTDVRVLILTPAGTVAASVTRTLAHGATATFSTHETNIFVDQANVLATGNVEQGVVNVESLESAVFCTAVVVDAQAGNLIGSDLHLVRVNPHPGTVE